MKLAIHDNDFLRQFEAEVKGCMATIEYAIQEKKMFLTKLNIPEEIRNEDFKNEFIRGVLNAIYKKNIRIVPTNPEIANFLRRNKKYKELLPAGIRL